MMHKNYSMSQHITFDLNSLFNNDVLHLNMTSRSLCWTLFLFAEFLTALAYLFIWFSSCCWSSGCLSQNLHTYTVWSSSSRGNPQLISGIVGLTGHHRHVQVFNKPVRLIKKRVRAAGLLTRWAITCLICVLGDPHADKILRLQLGQSDRELLMEVGPFIWWPKTADNILLRLLILKSIFRNVPLS